MPAVGKDHADNPYPEFRWSSDRLSCEHINVGKGLRIAMCFLQGQKGHAIVVTGEFWCWSYFRTKVGKLNYLLRKTTLGTSRIARV